ncbi:metallophosphoesterase [Gracilibacillus oryzae]|uniref:Metallophosphoesterase n=1 Tax=Gracilibacillus oryzae TaxID=1672701 RepID=A0A7C8GVI3_9BACI|nr:Ig-like domain-containing protein [Gracilibacillus oryzae]KAB8138114.1 metallophosphoesterase [Gracilibacillus oryzae]
MDLKLTKVGRNKRKKGKALYILLIFALVFSSFGQIAAAPLPETEYGTVLDTRQVELVPDVNYSWRNMETEHGLQKMHMVEFDPANEHLELQGGTSKGKVRGFQQLTGMAENVDAPGNRVISGINGDFYEVATGIPNGMFINNGEIWNTANSDNRYAFGITEDGRSVYGQPNKHLTKELLINGQTHKINHINRSRGDNQLVLYTDKYFTSTQTNGSGDEVIVKIVSGNVKSGETLVMEVVEVKKDQGNTKLVEGHAVLSASGTARNALAGLKAGDQIEASFQFEAPWDEVVTAIGGSAMLVEDGVANTDATNGVHPRSAIGTKADGSIVMFEVDGRQPGFSEGLGLGDLAQVMKDLGVENAINLDGGGSSTFIGRMPGDTSVQMLNSGSDGGERSNANGLLLVSTAQETNVAEKLVIDPSFERILAGSSLPLEASAVDSNGHAVSFDGELNWSVAEGLGSIANGQFTATDKSAAGEIRVSSANVNDGVATVEVVDQLTDLQLETAEMAVMPGESVKLDVTALRNGQVIQSDAGQFDWKVEGDIGSITDAGVFTATEQDAVEGKIIVSYGDIVTEMSINVGMPPVAVEDFDGFKEEFVFTDRYYTQSGAAYASVNAGLESNPDYVRSGDHSLRLDYDFRGKTGTSGAYLTVRGTSNRLEIPGYPTKLGMWVYGDGQGHWLRAQLRDGDNNAVPVNLTGSNPGVDWVGWRYVEASIPQGRPLPLSIDMPVRYMETSNNNKTAGTLYVDDIRVMYGEVEEDREPPVIRDIYPAANETIDTNMPTIQVFAEDAHYDPELHPANTLINPDKIRMYVDGEQVEPALYPLNGQISYTPEESLSDGIHHVKLAVRDMSENETIHEWQFNVDTGSSKFSYTTPENVYAGHTYTVDITANQVERLSGGHLAFQFDPNQTENWSVSPHSLLAEGQVSSEMDQNGLVKVMFENLENQSLTDEDILAQIHYTVKGAAAGTNQIQFVSGDMLQVGGSEPQSYAGENLASQIGHELSLEWDNQYAQGQTTTFTVKDEQGQPVAGAALYANGERVGDESVVTDENGLLQTALLTQEVTTHSIQAVEGIRHSQLQEFEISELSGNMEPYNISVAMGVEPATERKFNWNTHPEIDNTVVEVVKTEEFTSFDAENVIMYRGSNYSYNTTLGGTIRVHKASVDGLESGTSYTYRVGDGEGYYSQTGTFTTAPAAGNETKFLVFGDSQAGSLETFQLWGNTLDQAMNNNPDSEFILHMGDMVDHGHNEQQWNWWFETAQEHLLHTTVQTVVGNHEVTGTRMNEDYLAHYNNPSTSAPNEALDGTVYSFNYNNIHFVFLNSEYDYAAQGEWLRNDLAQSDKDWTVAVFHRSPYGSTYVTEAVQEHWVPVFDEFGVDLVLNGHDHIYLRSHPMKGGQQVAEGEGTTYMTPGATGNKFYGLTEYPWQKIVDDENTQMYSSVEVNGENLHVITKTVGGRTVDEFNLTPLDKPHADEEVLPDSITLNKTEVELAVGESEQLEATVLPEDASEKSVEWSVIDESPVVSVSAEGKITALAAGEATVRVTSQTNPDIFAEAVIRVTEDTGGEEPTEPSITLNKTEVDLLVGESEQILVTVLPENDTDKEVEWSVVGESPVVSVSQDGMIEALTTGEATVRVALKGNPEIYAEAVIRVTEDTGGEEPTEPSITLNKTEVDLLVGESEQLEATISAEDAADKEVDWSIVGESPVVSVSQDGMVKALAVGEATVRVALKANPEVYAEAVIRVTEDTGVEEPTEPESIKLNKNSLDLTVGESEQILATILPENTTDKGVEWSVVDQPSVVSINADGEVTALAMGDATVRATSTANPEVFADAVIHVTEDGSEEEPSDVTAQFTGPDQVQAGDELTLLYGLKGINGQLPAQHVTIHYDEAQLTFEGFAETAEKEGFSILSHEHTPGEIQFVAVDQSEDAEALNEALQKLTFRANETAESGITEINLDDVLMENENGEEVRIPGMTFAVTIQVDDKAEINDLIAEALRLHDNTQEGNDPGEYEQGSKEKLMEAIKAAQLVADDSTATNEELNQAVNKLTEAIHEYRNAANPSRPDEDDDDNNDGGSNQPSDPEPNEPEEEPEYTVGDLDEVSNTYGITRDHPDWEEYEELDFNDDGEIGLEDLVHMARHILKD